MAAQRAERDPAKRPAPGHDGAGATDAVCVRGCEGEISGRRMLRCKGKVTVVIDSFLQCVRMGESKWAVKERREGACRTVDHRF